jgi:hypothetical protein
MVHGDHLRPSKRYADRPQAFDLMVGEKARGIESKENQGPSTRVCGNGGTKLQGNSACWSRPTKGYYLARAPLNRKPKLAPTS